MKKIVLLGALALGMLTVAGTASAADYPPCSATVHDNCTQGARSAGHVRHARHHAMKKHHAKRGHHMRHHRVHHHRHHHKAKH